MNIGELTATLGVDTSGLPKAEKEFQKFTKTIEGTTASMNTHLRTQMGIIEEIEDTLEKLNTARKKAFKYDEIIRYNKKIAETKMHLKEYQNAGIEASKAVDSKMSLSKNVIGELSKYITKAIAVVYSLKGAFEVVKMSISATQGTADEFKIQMAGLKQGIDSFFIAISSGDWNNFWDGLQTSSQYAMELADTMDKLGDIRRGRAIEEVKLEGETARLLIKIRDTTGKYTIDQRKEFYNDLIKLNEGYHKEILDDATRERDDILNLYSSITGLEPQWIEEIISKYGQDYEKQFDEAGKRLNAAEAKWNKDREYKTPYGTKLGGLPFDVDKYLAGLSETDRFYTQLQMHFEKLNDSKLDKATASIIGVQKALNATDEMLQKYSKLHNQIFKPEKEEKPKKWENPYQASMNRYAAQLAQMNIDRKGKAPEFEETDYRKQFLMFGDINPMEELSAQLAQVALYNSAFGDSMDQVGIKSQTYADQIALVSDKMQILWDQGIRPGNALFDQYSKQLNKLHAQINGMKMDQEIVNGIMGVFSDIGSMIGGKFGEAINKLMGFIQLMKSFAAVAELVNTQKAINTVVTNANTSAQTANAAASVAAASGSAAAATAAGVEAGANSAAAVAGATKSGASLPFPANIAGIAVGVAAVIAALALVTKARKNAAKMARGGVVPEGYPNDTYSAMLTSGETVLPPGELPKNNTVVIVGRTKISKGDIYISYEEQKKHLQRVN